MSTKAFSWNTATALRIAWYAFATVALCAAAWGIGFAIIRFGWLYVFAALFGIAVAFVILRYPWAGMLMLAFFLPFERIGSIDIAGTTIRISQVVIMCVIASLFLAFARTRHTWHLPQYPLIVPVIGYAVVAGFALLNAPNLSRSVTVLCFVLFTMSVSYLVPTLVNSEERSIAVMRSIGAAMLLVTVFGVYQFVGDWIGLSPGLTGLREQYTKDILGFPRVQSTALEPLYFANYLLLPLSVLISLFLAQNTKVAKQWQVLGLLALGIGNLLLTVARGGYIAFAASVGVLLVYYFINLKLISPRNLAYAAALGFVGVVAIFQFLQIGKVADQALEHVAGLFEGASYNERVYTFDVALQAFREHPFVGIGAGSFGPYASWNPTVEPADGWAIVNNLYLEVLAETGSLGLIALGSIFLIVILRAIHALRYTESETMRTLIIGSLAAFIGILVQYNTFSILYIVHVWFVIGLLLALCQVGIRNRPSGTHNTAKQGAAKHMAEPSAARH